MPTKDHDESMAEIYAEKPTLALELINSVLEDGDASEMLSLLRQLTKAFGGVPSVAEQSGLNPTQLYRTLSPEGNPSLNTLTALLKAMGLRLAIAPIQPTKAVAKRKSKQTAA